MNCNSKCGSNFPELPWNDIKTYSLKERPSKVNMESFAKPLPPSSTFLSFWDSFPDILAAKDLRNIVAGIVAAKDKDKPILWGIGAHVIKVGLSPVMISLLEEGFISLLAMNSAGIIHDVELALSGQTSEDVPLAMREGTFGMARETAEFVNKAAVVAKDRRQGFGHVLGELLLEQKAPYIQKSLLARCYEAGIPVTVHAVIGGDIVHMHPNADGGAIGAASMQDFKIFTKAVANVGDGGVILNIGSSVVLPVVIEKSIALARNLGYDVSRFIGVTFDFIRQYRSTLNPVERANDLGGKGYSIIGHHELMIPLLAAALREVKYSSGMMREKTGTKS